jgi:putative DNA primase/helicase
MSEDQRPTAQILRDLLRTRGHYRPWNEPKGNGADHPNSEIQVEWLRASDVIPRNPDWLWPGYLAQRKISIFTGDSALGKSQISCAFAATITSSHEWPDKENAPDGSVIILSAEDDPEDTITPRLLAAGANLDRVHILKSVKTKDKKPLVFSVQNNLDIIADKITQVPDACLLIVDPITAFLGSKIDSYRITDVRAALQPLKEAIEALNVAALIIAHPAKSTVLNALNYVAGSGAFTHGPRLAFMAIADPKLPDRRLFLSYKNSLGKLPDGLGYFIESAFVGEERNILSSRVVWDSAPVTMTANEALAATVENQKSKTAKNEAGEFLRTNMADPGEPYSAAELIEAAKAKGINERTLRRAANKIGIRKSKKEFRGKMWWEIPDE